PTTGPSPCACRPSGSWPPGSPSSSTASPGCEPMTAPAPARRFLPLRYGADRRSLLFLALLGALLAGQWAGGLRHWLFLPPTCALAFVACVIKHNHVHCPTFTRRSWNAALGHVLGLLTGLPTTAIITAH